MGICQQISILSTARNESTTMYVAELPPFWAIVSTQCSFLPD